MTEHYSNSNSRPWSLSLHSIGLLVFTISIVALPLTGFQTVEGDENDQSLARNHSVDFLTEIMPIFSKHGCNAADCHGSATGRGELKLSLFGGDPQKDYQTIVHQLRGRRVNLIQPEKSLILTKPTEMLAHGGGEVFSADSRAAKRLTDWIRNGVPRKSQIQVERIEVQPQSWIATNDMDRFQVNVTAITNQGPKRVTADSLFQSSNPSALLISESGKAQIKQPGKYFVIVKYLNHIQTIPVIKPFQEPPPKAKLNHSNLFDQRLAASLQLLGVNFPKPASDAAFVRRIFLDLTGRLPSIEQARNYVNSSDPAKKRKLISELLESDGFQSHWAFWMRSTLQFRRPGNDAKAAQELNQWLIKSVREDTSWHEIARQLITSSGNTKRNPTANYHRFFLDARAEAESVAQSFMGIRIGCANCHNHPLDRWTQEDYHGLAAIFATMKRGQVIEEFPDGIVIQPKTGKPAAFRIPGEYDLGPSTYPRTRFMKWLPYSDAFKNNLVNRLWSHFMGRGLVEPIDDWRQSNPPIDGDLLQALVQEFDKNDGRIQPLIRSIVSSKVYASEPPIPSQSSTSSHWAGYHSKPMLPEVFHDTCRQVIYPDVPQQNLMATSNFELATDHPSLRMLKGCEPGGTCTSASTDLGLREKLHLINGPLINQWLKDPANRIHVKPIRPEETLTMLSGFYHSALSRKMTDQETAFWKEEIDEQQSKTGFDQGRFLEDALWSILNTKEFRNIR